MTDSVEKEKNRGAELKMDRTRHALIVNGAETILQHKPWRVLTALIDAAPETITRDALIHEVWAGNFTTGDKGLNHTLWTIRNILKDDARRPQFVRTIPREGYSWIGPRPVEIDDLNIATSTNRHSVVQRYSAIFAAAAAALMITAPLWPHTNGANSDYRVQSDVQSRQIVTASNGTRAFYDPREIVVEHFEGCKFFIKTTPAKSFSAPVFSENGQKIAFQVTRPDRCSLVVIDIENQTSEEFGACVSPGHLTTANPFDSGEFI